MKTKTAAVLTIHDAPNMHKRGRTEIANWLRRQAKLLERNHKGLAKLYIAHWQYVKKLDGRSMPRRLVPRYAKTANDQAHPQPRAAVVHRKEKHE